ncbi:MAG: hypothetical protein ABSF43_00805 [Rectinemataceae bacterium]|jgi:hypothetical protein
MKIILTAIASLLAFAVSAQGIASQAKDPVGKRVMVTFAASDISNEVLLRDSLEAALAASPLAAAVFRQGPEGEDPIASAARFSCPISLSVRAVGSENGVRVEWHFVSSAARNIELRGGSFDKAIPDARELASSFWIELVQDLGPAIEAIPQGRIVIAAPPGARVEGFGDSFVVPAKGEVELTMALPAFIKWTASSRSYFDAGGTTLIEAPLSRVKLPMRKLPAWTAELSLYGFSFPEARASILIGRRFFARATLTEFMAGLNLQNYDGPPPEPSVLSSYSLLHAGAGFGTFFEDPDKNLRFYAAMDAFFRFVMPGYRSMFIDPIAPIGISPLIGAEWGRDPRAKLYFELGGIFYPSALVDLMLASRASNGGNPVFYGAGSSPGRPGWFAEFPLPRLGLRVYL